MTKLLVINSLDINAYKQNIINKCLQTVQRKERQHSQESKTNINRITPNYRYISVPNMKGASECTCRLLRPYDLKLRRKPVHTSRSKLCNAKHKRETMDKNRSNS